MHKSRKLRKHDWPALILEWQGSGQTKSNFCKQNKLPMSGFYNALKREPSNSPKIKPQSSKFIKADFKSQNFETVDCIVEFPNRIKIKFNKIDAEILGKLANLNF